MIMALGSKTMTENRLGQWVPAIPLPLQGLFLNRCECGRRFWTFEGYEGHYALAHILHLDGGRAVC